MAHRPEVLECPNCAATLEPGVASGPFVRCQYCGAQVRVRPDDPPKPPARESRPPPDVARPRAPEPHPPRVPRGPAFSGSKVGLVLAVLVVAGIGVGGYLVARRVRANEPGELYGACLPRLKDGGRVLVLLSGDFDPDPESGGAYYRMEAVDPKTGQRLARAVFEWEGGMISEQKRLRPQAAPAGPDRLWVVERGQLQLRHPKTLAVIASFDQLKARNPDLQAGIQHSDFSGWSIEVDGFSGAAVVVTRDREPLWIDPRTLKGRRYVPGKEEVVLETSRGRVHRAAIEDALDLGSRLRQEGDHLTIDGERQLSDEQRRTLARVPRLRQLGESVRYADSLVLETAHGKFSFETDDPPRILFELHLQRPGEREGKRLFVAGRLPHPGFLSTVDDPDRPLVLPDDAGFVVVQRTRVMGGDEISAARLSLEGKQAWWMQLPGDRFVLAAVVGDLLIMALEGGRAKPWRALAVNWRNGLLPWRYGVDIEP